MAKPSLALVIGASKGKTDDEEKDPIEGSDEEESTEDYSSAASELFDAIKADDRSAFEESLKACILSCK